MNLTFSICFVCWSVGKKYIAIPNSYSIKSINNVQFHSLDYVETRWCHCLTILFLDFLKNLFSNFSLRRCIRIADETFWILNILEINLIINRVAKDWNQKNKSSFKGIFSSCICSMFGKMQITFEKINNFYLCTALNSFISYILETRS